MRRKTSFSQSASSGTKTMDTTASQHAGLESRVQRTSICCFFRRHEQRINVTVDAMTVGRSRLIHIFYKKETIARFATMRTDYQIRACDFLSVPGLFASVACSGAMSSCARSSHPRPSHGVGTGVPWVSMPGPTSVPSDAQAGWHRGQSANSVLCLCCVVVARAFDNLELWSW